MEQRELIGAFDALQSRVEKMVELEKGALLRSRRDRVRRRFGWSNAVEIVAGGLGLLLAGSVLSGNLSALAAAPLLGLPALFTFVCSLMIVYLSVRSLIESNELDFSAALTEAQTKLANLRVLAVRRARWQIAFWLLGWFLLPILIIQSLAGIEVLAQIADETPKPWLLGNVVFGVVVIVVLGWVLARSKYAEPMRDLLIGKEVKEAESFLAEIRAFELE